MTHTDLGIDEATWPKQDGRFLCSPERPMPKYADGLWLHPNAVVTGDCAEGCCDYLKCPDCGVTWRKEYAA
jgi:hypothetical protein